LVDVYYNSAGNFTYNASLANEKITSDDELFGNVLHKSGKDMLKAKIHFLYTK